MAWRLDAPAEACKPAQVIQKIVESPLQDWGRRYREALADTIDRYGLRDPEYAHQKLDGVPRPAVFVLDREGKVRWAKIESDYRERPTTEEVAGALDAFE